jgi:D-alanyl-D-alanine carboxypeptidase
VNRLNVIDGTSWGARITVRQLLNHTSGIYDHGLDPAYAEAVAADPQRQWTRVEQIEFALTHGEPYFPPGRGYHYSDTGYLLLGMIVEAATGQPLHALTRQLVIKPAHLRNTYTEQLEPAPAGLPVRAHQYVGPVDTTDFNPSFDLCGGGGLVSTAGDLARFAQALFRDRLLRPATLRELLTGSEYGLGVELFTLDGEPVWGHTGFLGAFLLYWPHRRLVITGSVNQADADSIAPAEAISRALQQSRPDH